MGYIRRKVQNYTMIAFTPDERDGDESIRSLAALRIRGGQEAADFRIPDFFALSPEKAGESLAQFQKFLSDDLVLTADISHTMPLMDKLYRSISQSFFTNTTMDILPFVEEAIPESPRSDAMKRKYQQSREEKDLLSRVRILSGLYEESSSLLFHYQEGFPYWISTLPKEEEQYLARHLPQKKKSLKRAAFAWLFGLHYFYLGQPKINILYLLTLGGCLFWMLLDLYRLPLLVDEANAEMADEVYKEAPKINLPGRSAPKSEKKIPAE